MAKKRIEKKRGEFMRAMLLQRIGRLSFIVGIVLAIISGLMSKDNIGYTELIVALGFIVGFLNVIGEESDRFLLASVSLAIISYTGGTGVFEGLGTFGMYAMSILEYIQAFVIPATIIVALKVINEIASRQ